MSFWKKRIHKSVQGFNANLSDGATRLRQQVLQPLAASSEDLTVSQHHVSSHEVQYVRIPIDSAKKLRWYDRKDLCLLIQLHLKEKKELFEANSALRQILQHHGVRLEKFESEVHHNNWQVDLMKEADNAVKFVLEISSQGEIDTLRGQVESLEGEVLMLQQQLASLQREAVDSYRECASHQAQMATHPVDSGIREDERVVLVMQLVCDDVTKEQRVEVDFRVFTLFKDNLTNTPGIKDVLVLLQQIGSKLSDCTKSCDPIVLSMLSAIFNYVSNPPGLCTDQGGIVHFGKFDATRSHCSHCDYLGVENVRLHNKLIQVQAELHSVRSVNEQFAQDAQKKLGESVQQFSKLLKIAQDSCLEAESRRSDAEIKLQLANQKIAELQLQQSKEICLHLQKSNLALHPLASSTDETHKNTSNFGRIDESKLFGPSEIMVPSSPLQHTISSLQRELAAAQAQYEHLLLKFKDEECMRISLQQQMHEVEQMALDRDRLATQVSTLEASMDQLKTESNQLIFLHSALEESENKRMYFEDELMKTAHLASTLERELGDANAAITTLTLNLEAANISKQEAIDSIPQLLAQQWEAVGVDRTSWPPCAQSMIDDLEDQIRLQLSEMDKQHAAIQSAHSEIALMKSAASLLQDRLRNVENISNEQAEASKKREQVLEEARLVANMEINELHQTVANLILERDRLEKTSRVQSQSMVALQNLNERLVGGGGLADVSISRVQNQNDDQCGDTTDSSVAYLNATDFLYFKNVLLKFVVAQSSGRTRECEILLPAIATLLKADKKEFEVLKDSISLHHNRTNVLDLGAWFS